MFEHVWSLLTFFTPDFQCYIKVRSHSTSGNYHQWLPYTVFLVTFLTWTKPVHFAIKYPSSEPALHYPNLSHVPQCWEKWYKLMANIPSFIQTPRQSELIVFSSSGSGNRSYTAFALAKPILKSLPVHYTLLMKIFQGLQNFFQYESNCCFTQPFSEVCMDEVFAGSCTITQLHR